MKHVEQLVTASNDLKHEQNPESPIEMNLFESCKIRLKTSETRITLTRVSSKAKKSV